MTRIALVGCGGRGTGAAEDCLRSTPDIKLVALADMFEDRLKGCREYLAGIGHHVEDKNCFLGQDAYKRVLDLDIDLVLLVTPPGFRPEQFAAAVEAGKHVFMEKPVAVDPVGVRRVIATGKKAEAKKLSVVAGTQYRRDLKFRETVRRVHEGAIGEILEARIYYNTGFLWRKDRQQGQSDLEWQLRNWYYFDWLSGDHIVEQHVHTIDVANWTLRAHPLRASGSGGRTARTGPEHGNIYDHFAIDYEYPGGVHVFSLCRQWEGADHHVGAYFHGTKGVAAPYAGTAADWKFSGKAPNAYVQEHADLVASILEGKPINEAAQVAESTLTAILGRHAAYTGKTVTWDAMLKSDLKYEPGIRPVPVPGA